MVTYVVGAVIGSISMHYIAMKYFEKPKNITTVVNNTTIIKKNE